MISGKRFINWIKEAERKHILTLLSFGGYGIYAISYILELSVSREMTSFGIGNGRNLFWLVTGLGTAAGLLEYSYLLQEKKMVFYCSLPVKKSTVFWSRYLHGILAGLLPLCLSMLLCGIYTGIADAASSVGISSYTTRSIAVYSLIFLLFYHITVLAVSISGTFLSALTVIALSQIYFHLFLHKICTGFAKMLYQTYYRISLLDRLEASLVPWNLGQRFCGSFLSGKQEVFAFLPDTRDILTMILWLAVTLLLFALAQKNRKPESAGHAFISENIERLCSIFPALLVSSGAAELFLQLTRQSETPAALRVPLLLVLLPLSASIVHLLLHILLHRRRRRLSHARVQIASEALLCGLAILLAFSSRKSFDTYIPERADLNKLSVSISGLHMSPSQYARTKDTLQNEITDRQLQQFTLTEDAMDTGLRWLSDIRENPGGFTRVTVCYQLKNGKTRYRCYPIDESSFWKYSEVYETAEYKAAAYPAASLQEISECRVIYSDGVTEKTLNLTGAEKEHLLSCYQSDIQTLEMRRLKNALPLGEITLESPLWGIRTSAVLYPAYENTCDFLRSRQISIDKTPFNYPVQAVTISQTDPATGFTIAKRLTDSADWAYLKDRLIIRRYVEYPLICPVEKDIGIELELTDEEANATVSADCCLRIPH